MSQRNSGYTRVAGDTYITPRWVYELLWEVEPWAKSAWDCAPPCAQFDFLKVMLLDKDICTNPPFSQAEAFVRHALMLTRVYGGKVAMLLPYAFDSAKGRVDLWGPPFKARYNIVRRIRWVNLEQKKAGPSQNHAWFVWDREYVGRPFIGWLGGELVRSIGGQEGGATVHQILPR